MIPTRSSSPSRNAFTIIAVSVLAAFVAFGCSDQSDPAGPGGTSASLIQQSSHNGQITVELRQGNTRYPGVLVTVVHNVFGPFPDASQDPETILKKVTNANGIATFTGLPLGGYCAHITAISDEGDATGGDDITVPITEQEGSLASVTIAPAITERQGGGGNVRLVTFSEANYEKNCIKTTSTDPNLPPIHLTQQQSSASLRLAPGTGTSLELKFTDLQGNVVLPAGWLVVGNTSAAWRENFTWLPANLPLDIHPGILVGVPSSHGQNGTVFRGLPPGVNVAIEALAKKGNQGTLVATGRKSAPASGTAGESFEMEPLMCLLDNTKVANPNTATGNALEVVGRVKDGFLANADFTPDADGISIWYEVQGGGSDALSLRFKSSGGATQTLSVSYSCIAGQGCQMGAASGPLSGSVEVAFFSTPFDASNRSRITWVLKNLPFKTSSGTNLASIEYSLQDYPEPSKAGDTRASSLFRYSPADLPALVCEVDQSNDPRWWIGN